jgi:hypothetical protein
MDPFLRISSDRIELAARKNALRISENVFYCRHPASTRMGRCARSSRHAGRGAMAADVPQRSLLRRRTVLCGREGVWSWRPDAGAKSAGDDPADDGGYQAGHRGERAISVKTVARGMPDVRLNLW